MLSNRHTDTHTNTQTKYCNPRCACAPRVNKSSLFVFDHKEPFIRTLPGMVVIIIQCHTFMDIFGPRTFLIFLSDIHSLSQNYESAESVYSVFVALQENPSLQKLEWVQPILSLIFTCEHFPIEFHLLLYTYMDDGVDPWFRIIVLIRWLCTFLTHYHGSNKSSHLWPTTECAYQIWCVWPQGIMVLIFHRIL